MTESAVLFDVSETIAQLREIRPIGVRIALDDLGTPYSSVALIKDLPLDGSGTRVAAPRSPGGKGKHLIKLNK